MDADWNLDTLLEVHYLFSRLGKRRQQALSALLHLADRNLKPITVSPLDLLKNLVPSLAYEPDAVVLFYSLAEFNTPAADEALKAILRESERVRNEDFKKFVEIAVAEGKSDLLKALDGLKLSQQKSKTLRHAMSRSEE